MTSGKWKEIETDLQKLRANLKECSAKVERQEKILKDMLACADEFYYSSYAGNYMVGFDWSGTNIDDENVEYIRKLWKELGRE